MQQLYELRIEYSQNGRVISDEVFQNVPLYDEAGEAAAREAAFALVSEMGCGSAAVYYQTTSGRNYVFTDMHYPGHPKPEQSYYRLSPLRRIALVEAAAELNRHAEEEANRDDVANDRFRPGSGSFVLPAGVL